MMVSGNRWYLMIVVGVGVVAGVLAWLFTPFIQSADVVYSIPVNNQSLLSPLHDNDSVLVVPSPALLDPRKVSLGRQLFNDRQLSHDNTIACASCHDLSQGGVTHTRYSYGIHHQVGTINAPTVFNSALNFRYFWDGRAATLEDQINGPIQNPIEMGSSWPEVVGKLGRRSDRVRQFAALYDAGITPDTIRDAIATFERSLNTPNSRFDQYLKGDPNAISADEKEGYRLFRDYGCISCHQGANLGGNFYEKLGISADYFDHKKTLVPSDYGRFNITHIEENRFEFKVPGLRNVALTAPYLHDGSAESLPEAIKIMAKYQLGITMPDHDVHLIDEFLHTLTGQYQGNPL